MALQIFNTCMVKKIVCQEKLFVVVVVVAIGCFIFGSIVLFINKAIFLLYLQKFSLNTGVPRPVKTVPGDPFNLSLSRII